MPEDRELGGPKDALVMDRVAQSRLLRGLARRSGAWRRICRGGGGGHSVRTQFVSAFRRLLATNPRLLYADTEGESSHFVMDGADCLGCRVGKRQWTIPFAPDVLQIDHQHAVAASTLQANVKAPSREIDTTSNFGLMICRRNGNSCGCSFACLGDHRNAFGFGFGLVSWGLFWIF